MTLAARTAMGTAVASVLEPLEGRMLMSGSWLKLPTVAESVLDAIRVALDRNDDDKDNHPGPGNGGGKKDDDDDDDDSAKPWKGHGNDTSAPVVNTWATGVNWAGGRTHTVAFSFSDDKKVRAASITADAFTAAGPGGRAASIKSVYLLPNKDAKRVVAAVTLDAPGGTWDAADAGRYTVALKGGVVCDDRGNFVTDTPSVAFDVNIRGGAGPRPTPTPAPTPTPTPVPTPTPTPPPTNSDQTRPTAAVSVSDPTLATAGRQKVTVVYQDDTALDLSTINPADLRVLGPNDLVVPAGSVEITSQSADRKTATAVYVLAAPDGAWDSTDNGAYRVTVRDAEVTDAAGNPLAGNDPVTFNVAVAAPPPVDPGFGGGTVNNPALPGFVAEAAVALPDGSTLVAGRVGDQSAGTSRGVVQRYDVTGKLDPSFGTNGSALSPAGSNDAFFGVALQGDKVLVAGTGSGDFLVARYTLAGQPDATFGGEGRSLAHLGADGESAYAVAVSPADGKIVLAGTSGGNYAFARFDPNGFLDLSFAQDGRDLFDLGSDADVAGAVSIMPDGRIVAAGSTGDRVAVVRLLADGGADASFDDDGLHFVQGLAARTTGNGPDRSQGLAVQPDGRIVLAGASSGGDFAVTRIDIDGGRDASFSGDGLATIDFGGADDADAVILGENGDLYVLGTSAAGGVSRNAVAALSSAGAPIASFGSGGTLLLAAEAPSAAREMHIGDLVNRAFGARRADGSIVVGNSGAPTAGQQQVTTSLRRLIVPGTRAAATGTALGEFGVINGRRKSVTFTDADGTRVTLTLKGGLGNAYLSGDVLNLAIAGDNVTFAAAARGGDGRFTLGDVSVNGAIRSFSAKGGDLAGTLSATAAGGRLTLGHVNGGTVAAAGGIASLSALSLTDAKVLAGATLGADGKLGGAGANADLFAAAAIGTVKVAGGVTNSLVAAGLDPADGTFFNDDDLVLGGETSNVRSISAAAADPASRFIAGAFGKVRIAGLDPETDGRVRVL